MNSVKLTYNGREKFYQQRCNVKLRIAAVITFIITCLSLSIFHEDGNMKNILLSSKDFLQDAISANENISATSWLNHLCPKYQSREKSRSKLKKESPVDDSIFFTQTSCKAHFTVREACAIESAAYHHPNRTIQVFMTSPDINDSHSITQTLKEMENVKFLWMDLDELFEDPYLGDWHKNRLWMYNEYQAPRFVSDAARVVLLWHYGGTYLDLDIITLRKLPLTKNYLGREDQTYINNAVMCFAKRHKYIDTLRKEISAKFDANVKSSIGPLLLTECLLKYCQGGLHQSTSNKNIEICKDVVVFASKYIYPLLYYPDHLKRLFISGFLYGPQFFKVTEAFTLHLFDALTSIYSVSLKGDSVLTEAARRNCPQVYATALRRNLNL